MTATSGLLRSLVPSRDPGVTASFSGSSKGPPPRPQGRAWRGDTRRLRTGAPTPDATPEKPLGTRRIQQSCGLVRQRNLTETLVSFASIWESKKEEEGRLLRPTLEKINFQGR